MHVDRRAALGAIAGLLQVGCGAPGRSFMDITMTSIADSTSIPEGLGIIVTRIVLSPSPPPPPGLRLAIHKADESVTFNTGLFDVEPGTNTYVVALRPNRYHWNELMGAGGSGRLGNRNEFECLVDKVKYIGDVDVTVDMASRKYGFRVVDRFRLAEDAYSRGYPLLSGKRPLQPKAA
jgi:hypothetical protein